jgi:hypothetical protein
VAWQRLSETEVGITAGVEADQGVLRHRDPQSGSGAGLLVASDEQLLGPELKATSELFEAGSAVERVANLRINIRLADQMWDVARLIDHGGPKMKEYRACLKPI